MQSGGHVAHGGDDSRIHGKSPVDCHKKNSRRCRKTLQVPIFSVISSRKRWTTRCRFCVQVVSLQRWSRLNRHKIPQVPTTANKFAIIRLVRPNFCSHFLLGVHFGVKHTDDVHVGAVLWLLQLFWDLLPPLCLKACIELKSNSDLL